MIRKAVAFAAKAHEGAVRKGSGIPYIYHPMEVALVVSMMTKDEAIIAAAYLHDVLEDTPVTAEEIRAAFGCRVLELVSQETEDKSRSWRERKGHTIEHVKTASREVKILTLADKVCNLRATARDYLATGDQVWERFNEKRKSMQQWYYRGLLESLSDLREEAPYQEMRRLYELVFAEPASEVCFREVAADRENN
ncbi:MAG: HD domain-containing protein [Clostridiales bacterium]|nr:HD domain-containing protein [Clostridiales bacterium]